MMTRSLLLGVLALSCLIGSTSSSIASDYGAATDFLSDLLTKLSTVHNSSDLLDDIEEGLKIFNLILKGIKEIMGFAQDPNESKEMKFMKKQFGKMDAKLNAISADIEGIKDLLQWLLIKSKLQEAESRILATNTDMKNFLTNKTDYYKNEFIINYDQRDMTRTVHDLHAAIVGDRPYGRSLLDRFMKIQSVHFHRGKTVAVIKRLIQLMTMGVQEVIAFRKVTGAPNVDEIISEWQNKINEMYPIFRSAIKECIDNFRKHAEEDSGYHIDQNHGKDNAKFAEFMYKFLTEKYNWLQWYVSSYKDCKGWHLHTVGGERIQFFRRAGRNFVASWRRDCCNDPAKLQRVRNYLQHGNFPTKPADQAYRHVVNWLDNSGIQYRCVHVVRFGNGLRATLNTAMTVFQNREAGGHSSSFVVMLE